MKRTRRTFVASAGALAAGSCLWPLASGKPDRSLSFVRGFSRRWNESVDPETGDRHILARLDDFQAWCDALHDPERRPADHVFADGNRLAFRENDCITVIEVHAPEERVPNAESVTTLTATYHERLPA